MNINQLIAVLFNWQKISGPHVEQQWQVVQLPPVDGVHHFSLGTHVSRLQAFQLHRVVSPHKLLIQNPVSKDEKKFLFQSKSWFIISWYGRCLFFSNFLILIEEKENLENIRLLLCSLGRKLVWSCRVLWFRTGSSDPHQCVDTGRSLWNCIHRWVSSHLDTLCCCW